MNYLKITTNRSHLQSFGANSVPLCVPVPQGDPQGTCGGKMRRRITAAAKLQMPKAQCFRGSSSGATDVARMKTDETKIQAPVGWLIPNGPYALVQVLSR